jgi:hypothetical protein
MVKLAVGTVVLVPFPFADLSATKLRPALVVASSSQGDWICAQITSNPYFLVPNYQLGMQCWQLQLPVSWNNTNFCAISHAKLELLGMGSQVILGNQ